MVVQTHTCQKLCISFTVHFDYNTPTTDGSVLAPILLFQIQFVGAKFCKSYSSPYRVFFILLISSFFQ